MRILALGIVGLGLMVAPGAALAQGSPDEPGWWAAWEEEIDKPWTRQRLEGTYPLEDLHRSYNEFSAARRGYWNESEPYAQSAKTEAEERARWAAAEAAFLEGLGGGDQLAMAKIAVLKALCESLSGMRSQVEQMEQMAKGMDRRGGEAVALVRQANALDPPESFAPLDQARTEIAAMRAELDAAAEHPLAFRARLKVVELALANINLGESPDFKVLEAELRNMEGAARQIQAQNELQARRIGAMEAMIRNLRAARAAVLELARATREEAIANTDSNVVKRVDVLIGLATETPLKLPVTSEALAAKMAADEANFAKKLALHRAKLAAARDFAPMAEQARDLACKAADLSPLAARMVEASADAGASVDAAEALYRAKDANAEAKLKEAEELAESYREDLRVVRGKLNYLAPLIAERQGRSDARAREQMAKLMAEKARLEKLEAETVADAELLAQVVEEIAAEQERVELGIREIEAARDEAQELHAETETTQQAAERVYAGLLGIGM